MSDVIDRLIRYCSVSTPSNEANEAQVPSNTEEFDLARMLVDELLALGVSDACVDEHCYVTAHVPASPGSQDKPCLGLVAHIDTSPDAPAHNVSPRIVGYEGGELVLGVVDGTPVTLTETNTPGLSELAGCSFVCTDGSTLLGADDKAGIAEIMSFVSLIMQDSTIPHPPLAICFAPDEEIGHGCSLLDVGAFGAEYAYTVDGDALGSVEYECFNAASATVRVQGREIHPGSAKNIMVNSLHVFMEFDAMLPAVQRPEYTEGYEGFFHLCDVEGSCTQTTAHYIVRDHDSARFQAKKQAMLDAAAYINARFDEPRVIVELRDQYRNMAEMVLPHAHLVENAVNAFRAIGAVPRVHPIRGGTDGAELSFRGLPCPNLSTGGYNFHSVREFAVVEQVEAMVEMLRELCALYA